MIKCSPLTANILQSEMLWRLVDITGYPVYLLDGEINCRIAHTLAPEKMILVYRVRQRDFCIPIDKVDVEMDLNDFAAKYIIPYLRGCGMKSI